MKIMRNSRPESIIEECEEILKRLKTDYIDLFVCHWPDVATPQAESMGAVSKLIEQGKILAAGVSNFSLEQMKEAHTAFPIALTQSQYSMVNREIEYDILPWCLENDVSVQAYSALQSGLLARTTAILAEDDPRRENPYFKPDNLRKVQAFLEDIEPIALAHNATIAQLALNWTINRPSVASAICGPATMDEVIENVESVKFNLAESDVQQINELLDKLALSL
jgi:aryl-alcohol dehydrogenase-like predicted oxidoreductase